MNVTSIQQIAGLIGESGRIQMLSALLSGDGHSASELALAAGVSAQTASSHLAKLLAGGLVACERRGRQRLYRLKNTDVAVAVEALGALAQKSGATAVPDLRFARTCYDHLAGVLSIALRDQLLRQEVLRQRGDAFLLTPDGGRFLGTLEIDVDQLRSLRRSLHASVWIGPSATTMWAARLGRRCSLVSETGSGWLRCAEPARCA